MGTLFSITGTTENGSDIDYFENTVGAAAL